MNEDLTQSQCSHSCDHSLPTAIVQGPSSAFQFKKSRLSSNPNDDEAELFNVFNVNDHEGDDDADISHKSGVSEKFPAVFRWSGQCTEVAISGSFNNWRSKIPLVKSEHDFYTIVDVPPGTHQYKYFVDGEWVCNPNEPKVDNDIGTQNNVVSVCEEDCDIYNFLNGQGNAYVDPSSSPPGNYTQFVPSGDISMGFRRFGPPLLPPQLLETVLNKDVSTNCEPTMVQEPSHVVLNHLYTLSIKGGVMVLSSTLRYRKKYVTTLLYKPI